MTPETPTSAWPEQRTASASQATCTTTSSKNCSRSAWACKGWPASPTTQPTSTGSSATSTHSTTSSAPSAAPSSRCSPASHDPAGLRARILDIATEHIPQLGYTPQLRFTGPLDLAVDEGLAADVLAVIREAISNCARHAHATRLEISIALAHNLLTLEITDNGRGLGTPTRSSGLTNMRRRAEHHHGTLTITTPEPGRHPPRLDRRPPHPEVGPTQPPTARRHPQRHRDKLVGQRCHQSSEPNIHRDGEVTSATCHGRDAETSRTSSAA